MVNFEGVKSEKSLRTQIKRNLNKEIHDATKPSVDFIYKILEDAYASGLHYDVTDMRNSILAFAASSTHQADYCIKLVNKMHFKSEEPSENVQNDSEKLVFYDVEVFPNLFLVNWKVEGSEKSVVRMINPSPADIEQLMHFRLVGFNCRRYDNHILYARLIGYDNEQLFNLSQKIIGGSANCFFGEAYNVSYTDVYDFCSKKQSLKKWEIELGLHHQELGLPWDQPVPEELWPKVAEYCDNDVIATEAVFNERRGDFAARQILAKLANGCVNDTTNSLSAKIIFGNNRKPQDQFNYRDLSQPVPETEYRAYRKKFGEDYIFRIFDEHGLPTYETYKEGRFFRKATLFFHSFPVISMRMESPHLWETKSERVAVYFLVLECTEMLGMEISRHSTQAALLPRCYLASFIPSDLKKLRRPVSQSNTTTMPRPVPCWMELWWST